MLDILSTRRTNNSKKLDAKLSKTKLVQTGKKNPKGLLQRLTTSVHEYGYKS